MNKSLFETITEDAIMGMEHQEIDNFIAEMPSYLRQAMKQYENQELSHDELKTVVKTADKTMKIIKKYMINKRTKDNLTDKTVNT